MSAHCPSCERTVENTYACPECDRQHCVECRLPDAHGCEPAPADSDADVVTGGASGRYAGLTPLQWLVVPAVLFLARAGGAPDGTIGYLAGQAFASFLIVYAGATLVERLRAGASEA